MRTRIGTFHDGSSGTYLPVKGSTTHGNCYFRERYANLPGQ